MTDPTAAPSSTPGVDGGPVLLVRPADVQNLSPDAGSGPAADPAAGAASTTAASAAAPGTPSDADGSLDAAQADTSAADAFAQFMQSMAAMGVDVQQVVDASAAGAGADSGAGETAAPQSPAANPSALPQAAGNSATPGSVPSQSGSGGAGLQPVISGGGASNTLPSQSADSGAGTQAGSSGAGAQTVGSGVGAQTVSGAPSSVPPQAGSSTVAPSADPSASTAPQTPITQLPPSVVPSSTQGAGSAAPTTPPVSIRPGSLTHAPLPNMLPPRNGGAGQAAGQNPTTPSSSTGHASPDFANLPSSSSGSGAGTGTAVRPSGSAAAGHVGTAATGAANQAHLSDGYTVSQVVADMQKLQANDKEEGGPQRTPQQLQAIAQGIVAGVNADFPASTYGSPTQMARTLVASAWKESKFDTTLGNGGVFQCAPNRLADYNQAHGTNIQESQLSTSADPSQAIAVSLWAMAHPSNGVIGKPVGGQPIPASANLAALYYWNYDGNYTAAGGGKPEIVDYMSKINYFMGLMK